MSSNHPQPGALPGPIDDRVESRLRVVGDRADDPPPGTQRELPLRWIALAEPEPEPPATIAIQPVPLKTEVTYFRTATGEVITTIHRDWAPGESGPGGRCTRCVRCGAVGDSCMMSFSGYVARGPDAADYSPKRVGAWFAPF